MCFSNLLLSYEYAMTDWYIHVYFSTVGENDITAPKMQNVFGAFHIVIHF